MWLLLTGKAHHILGKQAECAVTPTINTLPHTASSHWAPALSKHTAGRNDREKRKPHHRGKENQSHGVSRPVTAEYTLGLQTSTELRGLLLSQEKLPTTAT